MAKNELVADQNEGVQELASKAEIPLTLTEYCIRRSQTDRRVELIGAFEHTERVAGRLKSVTSVFDARFTAFANSPA